MAAGTVSTPTGLLANLLEESLVMVDVGCRWGFSGIWDEVETRCTLIGFDADVAECGRLQSAYRGGHDVRFVPLGLGAEPGPATLYLTADRGGCSVYRSSADAVDHHPGLEGGRVEGTVPIELTTLDHWCAENEVARVDMLKIDTQGSELDILRGGSGILDTVRALELEVEFNPLYDDVPLFWEIDKFLREQGFVLWRLDDLAHYAQRGMRQGWRGKSVAYFDEHVSTFFTGAGQLYWANASYVQASVARPDATAGWKALVRDACVTAIFGFGELSELALERARASAPPEVASRLDAALSERLLAAEHQRVLAERSVTLSGSLVVDVGESQFSGSGWHPPQVLSTGPVRWTGPAREASVEVPIRLPPGTRVELLAVAGMSPAILADLVVEVNRTPVPLQATPQPEGILYSGTVPDDYASARRFTRVVVRTVDTVPWNELAAGSEDDRELGVAVRWIRFAAPEPVASPPST